MGIAVDGVSVQLVAMRAILIMAAALALGACDNVSGEAEVKAAVSRNMLDPDAVQFRDLERCTEDTSVWQGEFNAKNAYGAYTGFEAFFYSNGAYATTDSDEGTADFMALLKRCFGKYAETSTEDASAPADKKPLFVDEK